jgi:dimethylargininase
MMITTAIVRQPAPNFADGLTTAGLGRPDYSLMSRQHQAYMATLRQLGLEVIVLDPLPDYPDAHFVEDVAVITPELAVITRPGAPSRQGETAAMQPIVSQYRPLACIEPPGCLEGGDVLLVALDLGTFWQKESRSFLGIEGCSHERPFSFGGCNNDSAACNQSAHN